MTFLWTRVCSIENCTLLLLLKIQYMYSIKWLKMALPLPVFLDILKIYFYFPGTNLRLS